MSMSLTPEAIAILEQWKRRHAARALPVSLSLSEIAEVHEAQRRQDARSHAVWAAGRLVLGLKNRGEDAYKQLVDADLWALRTLEKGYLVRRDWLAVAYQHALKLAGKNSRSVN
jgi:lipopolysaccharide biosynthesis regulator YciM